MDNMVVFNVNNIFIYIYLLVTVYDLFTTNITKCDGLDYKKIRIDIMVKHS